MRRCTGLQFDDVVATINAGIGHPDMAEFWSSTQKTRSAAELESTIEKAVGETGLMLFVAFDHGAIISKTTGHENSRIIRFVIGNPLIMKEMAKRVPDAGSYAPVTVLVDERTDGVHLSYDRMASLLAPYANPDALEVARNLDIWIRESKISCDELQPERQLGDANLRRENSMANKTSGKISAQPRLHQRAPEIQDYGTVNHLLPLELEEPVRLEMTAQLNQLLADTMTLRDLYKKSHWQVAGPTFYQLHLLFDKHYDEQVELVDSIAERIQLLGGVSIAMAADVAEVTQIERPPRGREAVSVQLSRLLDAHQIVIRQTRKLARRASELGDDGSNDLLVSDVLRTNELQVWFVSEHLVDVPLIKAQATSSGVA